MAKAIHKSCCLQAGASEAAALIEKVISEEQTWGTYKIDKTKPDGAYAAFVCTPVWTFSLYHNSFVPDTHITVREDNGKSQIGFDFTQCRSAKLAGILINSFLLLFAVAVSVLAAAGKCAPLYAFAVILVCLFANLISHLMFRFSVSAFYNSITSKLGQTVGNKQSEEETL